MTDVTRYRSEDAVPCIDVNVRTIEQLFDNRDPAPFRERDLDPEVAEYVLDAGADLAGHSSFSVVFWLEQPAPTAELEHAFRAHFEDARARIRRRRRRDRRSGTVMLLLALAVVLLLLMIAQVIAVTVPGAVGAGLKEWFVISSWVVLWRPAEILIYGWIPARQERRLVERVLGAKLFVRTGRPPS